MHIASLKFDGIDIIDFDVQVQISPGIHGFAIVVLADKTMVESKELVKAASSS